MTPRALPHRVRYEFAVDPLLAPIQRRRTRPSWSGPMAPVAQRGGLGRSKARRVWCANTFRNRAARRSLMPRASCAAMYFNASASTRATSSARSRSAGSSRRAEKSAMITSATRMASSFGVGVVIVCPRVRAPLKNPGLHSKSADRKSVV